MFKELFKRVNVYTWYTIYYVCSGANAGKHFIEVRFSKKSKTIIEWLSLILNEFVLKFENRTELIVSLTATQMQRVLLSNLPDFHFRCGVFLSTE